MPAHLAVRKDDPDTSYAAAVKAAIGASAVRPVVLDIVREHGPLTHDELIGHYRHRTVVDLDTPRSSDSGIRTRLRELVEAGLVTQDETKGRSQYGNAAKRWVAVDVLTVAAGLSVPDEDPSVGVLAANASEDLS